MGAKKDKKNPAEDNELKISFFQIFRYGTCAEVFATTLGIFIAAISGGGITYNLVQIGELSTAFVERTSFQEQMSTQLPLLSLFGGGQRLSNASREENMAALVNDAIALMIGAFVSIGISMLCCTVSVALISWSALRQLECAATGNLLNMAALVNDAIALMIGAFVSIGISMLCCTVSVALISWSALRQLECAATGNLLNMAALVNDAIALMIGAFVSIGISMLCCTVSVALISWSALRQLECAATGNLLNMAALVNDAIALMIGAFVSIGISMLCCTVSVALISWSALRQLECAATGNLQNMAALVNDAIALMIGAFVSIGISMLCCTVSVALISWSALRQLECAATGNLLNMAALVNDAIALMIGAFVSIGISMLCCTVSVALISWSALRQVTYKTWRRW
ncbi:hypothetical protein PYW07_000402 [Mythimna separata]|uniref:Uncharacterized protein n=1 Tax=Mythimna separata TaxID=271217 RepID=A0AAD7Z2U1_MYTSE|nr:hypothetical protein PYW07_000402 [Mythimna separata]